MDDNEYPRYSENVRLQARHFRLFKTILSTATTTRFPTNEEAFENDWRQMQESAKPKKRNNDE